MTDAVRVPTLLPGKPATPLLPLARYRDPQIAGCLEALLVSTTRPGDLVVELASQGPGYIRETLHAGRRVISLNINPLPLLASALWLDPPAPESLRAALTRLGDLPKGERPLFIHLRELYRARCPTCNGQGVAEWFAWDRDVQRPYAKRVRCPRCASPQEGPVDEADLEVLRAFPPKAGPAYHLAVGRAAAADDPLRERAAELAALYTPRALNALMDVSHRLSQAAPTPQLRRGLTALLLEALDQGTSLTAHGETAPRPRSFKPPARFLERNVWLLLEEALRAYEVAYAAARELPAPPGAVSLPALLATTEPAYVLLSRSLQFLVRALPPASVGALVLQPSAPDALFWALSALWTTWLWGQDANPQLRPFLGRRRLDWDWYRDSLRGALQLGARLLRPGGLLLVLLPRDEALPLATALAGGAAAGLAPQHWLAAGASGYRVVLGPAAPAPAQSVEPAAVLRRRGEPTPTSLVQAALLAAAPEQSAPALELPQRLNANGLLSPAPGLLWLAQPQAVAPPLADRVELHVFRLLQSRERWAIRDLLAACYTRFAGELSPDPALIEHCLASYATAVGEQAVGLLPTDAPIARQAEIGRYVQSLRELGERLGFMLEQPVGWDCVWTLNGQRRYGFRFTALAVLGEPLLQALGPGEGRRCLVLPGSRAGLVSYKLQHDGRLGEALQRERWVFIKFRHLRRMFKELNNAAEMEVYLGLDPIVEQERAQIPLPLDF